MPVEEILLRGWAPNDMAECKCGKETHWFWCKKCCRWVASLCEECIEKKGS